MMGMIFQTRSSVWGDSAVIIPWTLYQMYGDIAVLQEQYPMMRGWVDYIAGECGEDVLWMNGFQRGDWLGLGGDESLHSMSGGTDRNLVANACHVYSCRIVRLQFTPTPVFIGTQTIEV